MLTGDDTELDALFHESEGHSVATGISIICCYNDDYMRRQCLDASLERYSGNNVQYIPVNNREQVFTTAGAAFNYGVTQADQDVVVFVQQDIYLHSIERLLDVATHLRRDDGWGLLGANGPDAAGELVGRVRDRVLLAGRSAPNPIEVESLDEILLMTTRDQATSEPFTEDPRLAWHAYGVEYGLRVRRAGLKVGASNCALTHNSLTLNLARLDVAHQTLAEMYPDLAPIRTTCGIATGHSTREGVRRKLTRVPGAVVRWTAESAQIWRAVQFRRLTKVLADIRDDVDLIDSEDGLLVLNHDARGGFAEFDSDPLWLHRRDRSVEFRASGELSDIREWWDNEPKRTSLVTGLRGLPLESFLGGDDLPVVVGSRNDEVWLLRAPILPGWSGLRSRPILLPFARMGT